MRRRLRPYCRWKEGVEWQLDHPATTNDALYWDVVGNISSLITFNESGGKPKTRWMYPAEAQL